MQRTNKTPIDLFAVALEHAVEKILRNERFCYRLAAQTHPRNAPAQIPLCHRRVGVHRLVRAMECTESEMNESAPHTATIVSRAGHKSGQRQRGSLRKTCHPGSNVVRRQVARDVGSRCAVAIVKGSRRDKRTRQDTHAGKRRYA